ncbi:hypothetical protein EDC30_109132 [Paucimonas lemoignei]|uniref:Uncharacterized protein n=1 Tax=Paucimonas lemoignei TaxID=29443 RepID=A0A4R3HTN2_PAULE|nr:hypothetical protein EDC30_109132 [Paucimonas lemoignei]
MILSSFFNVSLQRRGLLATRLAPCLLPRASAQTIRYEQTNRCEVVPEKVFVSWLFWQFCIAIKIESITTKQ